ncbi:MAG: tyrosine-type recombinase/integrase [Chloroflexi bacterium]|nr:tyrosine-type recombinase/integrase [Chloroflexota bacterium]
MLKNMIEAKRSHVPEPGSLRQAIDRYQTFNRSERKSPNTILFYKERLGKLIKTFGPEFQMADFDEPILREHLVGYSTKKHDGTPLRPGTLNAHARALRAFFRWCYLNDITASHLLALLRPPRPPIEIVDVLEDDEMTKLMAAARRRKRDHAIITLMLDTGVRAAELCGITIGNVDMGDNTIKVMGKGSKERMIPFGRTTRRALLAYATEERPDAGYEEAVFLSSYGARLRPDTLRQIMVRLRNLSGIERLHAHLMRHTFATKFLLNGGDALMLKHILGHSTLAMTDRYVHFASAQGVKASREFSPVDRHVDGRSAARNLLRPDRKRSAWPTSNWQS